MVCQAAEWDEVRAQEGGSNTKKLFEGNFVWAIKSSVKITWMLMMN
jgi:hypothetical protein